MAFIVWLYNSNTGAVVPEPDPYYKALLISGLGWHGPFNSVADAVAYYEANKTKNPGWQAPTGSPSQAISNAGDTAVKDTKNILGSQDLQVWALRIGELLIGLVLVGVGLAKLTGAENFITNTLSKMPIPI